MNKSKNKKTILAGTAVVLALLVVGIVAYSLEGRMSTNGVKEDDYQGSGKEWEEDWEGDVLTLYDKDYLMQDRCETFLIAGTDFSGNESAKGKDYEGSMADFLVLYVVNHSAHTYALLPIDRNTMMDVPMLNWAAKDTDTYYEQVCTAHWYGRNRQESIDNTVHCISTYLGDLNIDGYYFINRSQIKAINHALGGVTVTLEDDFTDLDPTMEKGRTLKLNDDQAAIFVRDRMKMDYDGNDRRMSRQRVYFTSALKQVKARLKDDPNYVNKLYESFQDVADSNISGNQLSRGTNAFISYEDQGVLDIQGETRLGDTFKDGINHEEFYPNKQSVVETMTRVYRLEPDKEE